MLSRLKYITIIAIVVAHFLLTRNDLAVVRTLATDNMRFSAELATITQLEKDILYFHISIEEFVNASNTTNNHDVKKSYQQLRSRVETLYDKFDNPQIATLNTHHGLLGEFMAALRRIDGTIANLGDNDRQAAAQLDELLDRFGGPLEEIVRDASAETMSQVVKSADAQHSVIRSLNHVQLISFLAGALGVLFLFLELRRNNQLVADLRRREQEIRTLAMTDPLTGLLNRRAFNDRMQAIDAGRRQAQQQLLLVDLDDFKKINDEFGHAAGDRALRVVAQRLSEACGAGTFIARIGGDEFGILVEAGAEAAIATASAILAALSSPLQLGNASPQLGASIGIAEGRTGPSASVTTMREADIALYEAKALGRNRFQHYASSAGRLRKMTGEARPGRRVAVQQSSRSLA